MELVPFYDNWTGSETKLDLKAIYRRPDPKGITLTSPLPLRRHKSWAAKGFQFLSLATLSDLSAVAGDLRAKGHDPLTMRTGFDRDGNFDTAQYIKHAKQDDATYLVELQAKVDKFGAAAVTEMMQMQDAAFVMPEGIVAKASANDANPKLADIVEPKGKGK
jgi:hypothetical protein